MVTLKRNTIANFIGKAVNSVCIIVFTPVYLTLLGLEAYSIVALAITVRALFTLFDFGMSIALNREVAGNTASNDFASRILTVIKTFETCSWAIAGIGVLVFILFSGILANSWFHFRDIPSAKAQAALCLLVIAAGLQLPTLLYQGGLAGLQQQTTLNKVLSIGTIIRDGGAALVLVLISRSIEAFFVWQIIASFIHCFWQRASLLRYFRPATIKDVPIDLRTTKHLWVFTLGTGAVAITVMVLGSADKVLLSNLVSMELFGVYCLVQTVATAIVMLVSPFYAAIFPRFVEMISRNDYQSITELYHKSTQIVSVLIFPVATVIICFSEQILLIWTGSVDIARSGSLPLMFLAMASTFNALLYLPLAVQLAHGWTRLTFFINLISMVFYVPALIIFTRKFGIVGTSFAMFLLMISQIISYPVLMHRKLLKKEMRQLYWNDFFVPMIPSIAVSVLLIIFPPGLESRIAQVTFIALVWLILTGCSIIFAPTVRNTVLVTLKRM